MPKSEGWFAILLNIFPGLKAEDFPGAAIGPFELTLHRRANALPPCPLLSRCGQGNTGQYGLFGQHCGSFA